MKELIKRERIIGTYNSNKKGPLLFVTASVHGNEPSGLRALESIFATLHSEKPTINGQIVGVIGNTAALDKNVRYMDEDLNRTWTHKNIQNKIKDSNEKKEMFEIIEVLEALNKLEYTHLYFIDCHTTSSESLPYISVQDVGENDAWAQQFPLHIIRGFSDIVEGTIDGYLSQQNMTGFIVEAGQHYSDESQMYHEGIIWMALQNVCDLNINSLPKTPDAFLKTISSTPSQKKLKIIHRFALENNDEFEMKKGFKNFQPIKKGEYLATFNGKQINSVWDAYIFMPLYQEKGNDGFFVIDEVKD